LGFALTLTLFSTGRAGVMPTPPTRPLRTLTAHAPQTSSFHRILRERRGLKPGMVILDRRGSKVGVITQTDQIKNGHTAVLLDVDGAQFKVRTSNLKLTRDGEEAVIALTKSQIETSAILNTY